MGHFVEDLARGGIGCGAVLAFVNDGSTLQFFGWLKHGDKFLPINALSMPGPYMSKLAVHPVWPLRRTQARSDTAQPAEQGAPEAGARERREVRFSRLFALVGEGDIPRGRPIVTAARRLRVTVVGTGRLGSSLVLSLAQAGIGTEGWLIIADGDIVEMENLDGMFLPADSVGMPKAEAVAREVLRLYPDSNVKALVGTLSDAVVAEVVTLSDVVFSVGDRYIEFGQ